MNHYDRNAELIKSIKSSDDALSRVDLPHVNYYADGVYVRTLNIPAGVAIVGKIHKTDHVFGLVKGEIIVDDGGSKHRIVAPEFFVVKAGAQRVIVAVEDAMILNAHGVKNGMTFEEIEDYLTTENQAELPDHVKEGLECHS